MKRIRKAARIFFPAAALCMALLLLAFRVRIYLVMSGSMEPEIRTGSFVFVRELRRVPVIQSEAGEERMTEQGGKSETAQKAEWTGKPGQPGQAGKPGQPGQICIGDIVAYRRNGMMVLHRVAEIRDDGRYVTKGDANRAPDAGTVGDEDIFGKYLFSIGLPSWYDKKRTKH